MVDIFLFVWYTIISDIWGIMMKNKQNLHTHSTFCDGKNTPEDTVKKAIERGFDSIGFSIHSRVRTSPQPTPFENFEPFKAEIARLKEQ